MSDADLTLANLNMLYVRYGSRVDRERHVPLGPLYVARALEDEGCSVDFRDFQTFAARDPFARESFFRFLAEPGRAIGLSVMANLLPFAILAIKEMRERWPDRPVILGGVGPKAVEEKLVERFPWIDLIVRGEAERTMPVLMRTLESGGDLSSVPGLTYRRDGAVVSNPAAERIEDLDSIPFPAFHLVDLAAYDGYGMITSRGCPYPCNFCSVAPVWDHVSKFRSVPNVIEEMRRLNEEAGVKLFLFQDEFFVSGPRRVREFCRELSRAGLDVRWKAFGRVNLTDEETMRAMVDAGCVEIRYGVESGSDAVLERTKKGFTSAQVMDIVPRAVEIFPSVDVFYVWGFPYETMEDFCQSVFQMVSFRSMGARVLPSLLSLLPQTALFEELEDPGKLEFCAELLPEYMLTGHEVVHPTRIEVPEAHRPVFDLIAAHPDLFPGFYHYDLAGNVRPKLAMLREMGFYPSETGGPATAETESCGAHSPRLAAKA